MRSIYYYIIGGFIILMGIQYYFSQQNPNLKFLNQHWQQDRWYTYWLNQIRSKNKLFLYHKISPLFDPNKTKLETSIKLTRNGINTDRYIIMLQDLPELMNLVPELLKIIKCPFEIVKNINHYLAWIRKKKVAPSMIFGFDGHAQQIKIYIEQGGRTTNKHQVIKAFRYSYDRPDTKVHQYSYYNDFDHKGLSSELKWVVNNIRHDLVLNRTHYKKAKDSKKIEGYNFRFKEGTTVARLRDPIYQNMIKELFGIKNLSIFNNWLNWHESKRPLTWMFLGLTRKKELAVTFYVRNKL